jgi:hypothetical protein
MPRLTSGCTGARTPSIHRCSQGRRARPVNLGVRPLAQCVKRRERLQAAVTRRPWDCERVHSTAFSLPILSFDRRAIYGTTSIRPGTSARCEFGNGWDWYCEPCTRIAGSRNGPRRLCTGAAHSRLVSCGARAALADLPVGIGDCGWSGGGHRRVHHDGHGACRWTGLHYTRRPPDGASVSNTTGLSASPASGLP